MNDNRTEELYQRYTGALRPWQIKLAIARMKRYRVPPDAWDDTMQELAIVAIELEFDPAKAHTASEQTILCRAMDNRIRMLARSNARRLACLERLSQLSQNGYEAPAAGAALAEGDVRQLLDEMSPAQREICLGLMAGESVHQIARRTGRAWNTIQRQIDLVRKLFVERGVCV